MPASLVAILFFAACSSQHEEPVKAPVAVPAPAPEPVEAEEAQAEPDGPRVAPGRFPTPSAWSSPACDERPYERQIRFDDGRFAAKDLVSPCPPDKVCVWSGIIDRTGTWTLDRKQLRLTVSGEKGQDTQADKFPLPPQLWLAADGTLTEDEGACPYARGE